jgi:hypothetical protein
LPLQPNGSTLSEVQPPTVTILGPIQAATAPVVLISGIGLLLLTLTGRLGRIVDRARLLADRRATAAPADREGLEAQLTILRRRARLVRLSILLSASAIVLLAVLIALLFVGVLLEADIAAMAAVLFIASVGCLVAGLLAFVRELFEALTALDLSIEKQP